MADLHVEEARMSQSESVTQATQGPTQKFPVQSQDDVLTGHASLVSTKPGEQFEFKFEESTNQAFLGRSLDCEIRAKDSHVSKKHLRIYRDEQLRYFVEQLSAAGTFINKDYMRKDEHRSLKHGDTITIATKVSDAVPFASFFFRVESGSVTQSGAVDLDKDADGDHELRNLVTDDWVRKNWSLREELGSGHFSCVQLGIRIKQGKTEALKPGLRCAVKIIDKKTFVNFQSNRSSGVNLNDEAELMSSLQHPNIVSCSEWFQTQNHMYLALECVPGGDLLHNLMDGGCLTEIQAVRIFRQVCGAVQYLHVSMSLVHRDLKPENILLTNKDRDTMIPKLADFGLARINQKSMDCRTFCGTPQYFAPEVIGTAQNPSTGYGKQVDMWSLGVILYIMLCGVPPFEDEGLYTQIQNGRWEFDVPQFSQVSEEAKNLIRKLMKVNPRERISIQGALNEPWFRVHEFATPARSTKSHAADMHTQPAVGNVDEPMSKRRKSEAGMVIS